MRDSKDVVASIFLSAAIDKFSSRRALGEFILIDRVSNMTSACGVLMPAISWMAASLTKSTGIDRG